jgi:anti-sigma factor RsiW
MNLSEEVLMAYADGELDAKTRDEVEAAMAADPQVARRVAEHEALRSRLRVSFDKVLDETVPERLLAAARRGAASPMRGVGEKENVRSGDGAGAVNGVATTRGRTADVVPLRGRQVVKQRAAPFWGAIAASFVVGALVWHFGAQLYSPAPIAERDGELLASGALDKALSTQLVRDQDARSAVHIGVSFRAKDGSYCRTFQLRNDNGLAGLACRQQDKWKLQVVAQGDAAAAGGQGYRPAGSSLPSAVAQAVDQSIDGEPLDAEAEAQAKARGWEVH